jgi:hypothetical protein
MMERSSDHPPFGAVLLSGWNFERKSGAGDRGRTGDVQLGKLAFYR